MQISVIGVGYVGLVTAACLAEWGHEVTGVDADPERVDALRRGRLPFHEPGLKELVDDGLKAGRLRFRSNGDADEALAESQVCFVAVGTHDGNGGWQTDTVDRCLQDIVPRVGNDTALVLRSTLPPEYVARVAESVASLRARAGNSLIPVLVNPEFTREGRAVQDFLQPERVIFGVAHDPDGRGHEVLHRVYTPHVEAPVLTMSAVDAMLSKLGANLFLATKVSFANELADLCEAYGASVEEVVRGMAHDHRIGGAFMQPGVGFGGSCLPQQVSMTVAAAAERDGGAPLLSAVDLVNRRQRVQLVDRLAQQLDNSLDERRVALLGLSFKPGTDDLREAPSLTVARLLLDRGAEVAAYDPMPAARAAAADAVHGLEVADSAMEALDGADAAALVTEWPEFGELDWHAAAQAMRSPILVDGRNYLSPDELAPAGFSYRGFGVPPLTPDGDGAAADGEPADGATPTGEAIGQEVRGA
jgi:UDPglucose 6-dehydrogenase